MSGSFAVLSGSTPATPSFTNSLSSINPDKDWAVVTPNAASLVITDNLTVLIWVKAHNSSGQDVVTQFALAKAQFLDPAPRTGYSWSIAKAFSGGTINNMEIMVCGSNSFSLLKNYIGSQMVWDSNWHMIGFRFAGGVLDLFVDGVKDTSVTKRIDASFSTINDGLGAGYSDVSMNAFKYPASGFTWFYDFVGNVDEPAIWNTALSDQQITNLYNGGVPVNLLTATGNANLQLWHRCGDDSRDNNTTVYDQTANGNNGAWVAGESFPITGAQYSTDVP